MKKKVNAKNNQTASKPLLAQPAVMPRTIEFCFDWGNRIEVRYRRLEDSEDAKQLMKQYDDLKAEYGGKCLYFYRYGA